jgi:hypothetical protein
MIHEPMTLATDYLLAIAAAGFAWRLWRVQRLWALAFVFTAAGSFFGGTYHGFVTGIAPMAAVVLWKLTIFSIGLASYFLLVGSAGDGSGTLPAQPAGTPAFRWLSMIAIVKLVVYLSWMIVHDEFVYVIADYGLTLLIIGIAQLVRRGRSTPWVIGSIVVSVIGALVQQSGFALHRHFNHNDLYHLIQLVALWLLYRGGRLMNPSTAPPTSPPR